MRLEPGEVICDKCKGTGHPNNNEIDYKQKDFTFLWVCNKCNGEGKLDWIEAVVGKKKLFSVWGQKTMQFSTAEQLYSEEALESDYGKIIIEKVAQQIADGIDKDIIRTITGECNES